MKEMHVRLKKIMDYYRIKTYSDFAKRTGLSHQTASNYIKGKQKPDSEKLALIKQSFTEVNANWLLTGEGEMLLNNNEIETLHGGKIAVDKIVDTILLYSEKFEENQKFANYIETKENKAIIRYQEALLLKYKEKK